MRSAALVPFFAMCAGCTSPDAPARVDLKPTAERYFTGVFGCEQDLIAETAAPDVVVSYPIFESIFGSPTIRGSDAVREFSVGFCSRWLDPQIVVHEAIQDSDRVVLVWGFSARPSAADTADPAGRESWGGISVFRFDDRGRVIEEIGEESTPGPVARLRY